MKRSFLTVLVAASVMTFGACAGDQTEDEIEPVEDVMQPAPVPAPVPVPDTTMRDTTMRDTTTTTTGD
jgi:hypothetical protein